MTTSVTFSLCERFNPLRLAGPIFDKELRVASRQRRSYVLRCAYIGVLMVVVAFFWLSTVHIRNAASPVVAVSRMSEAGKYIVTTIVWFQFVTGQLLAIILLSGAIGSEIRQRSLDVLLVTPISSLQIVVGKLLSKLLQLVSLLAISLPLLAIVRVFGGVPWDYVVSGFCITLTAALFTGSLSLLLSITHRHTHQVFMTSITWCFLLWFGLSSVPAALAYTGYIRPTLSTTIAQWTVPFALMVQQTRAMFTGGRVSVWPWHCLIMLAAAVVVLLLCIWRVRRTALARIVARKARHATQPSARTGRWPWRRTIRRITGSPIVWKELRRPLFPRVRRGFWSWLFFAIAVGAIAASVIVIVVVGRTSPAPLAYGLAYLLWVVFVINTTSCSASAITREKEARTWPILLATPLENGEIVRGKAIGSLRRNLPLLAPVPVLVVLALLFDSQNVSFSGPVVVFIVGWLLRTVGAVVFLIGTALYMGTRVRTTTPAVVTTFVIYLVSRMVLSVGAILLIGRSGGPAMLAIAGLLQGVVYVLVGLATFNGAMGRLRRNVFA